MSLLLCMSLCGTIFFLFAFCVEHFALKSVGARFVYRLYKLALLLFLLPFQYYKFHYLDLFRTSDPMEGLPPVLYFDNSKNLSFALGDRLYFYPRTWAFFSVIGLFIFVVYAVKQYHDYRKAMHRLDLSSTAFSDPLFEEARLFQKPPSKKPHRIRLYRNPDLHSPIAAGILHARIFIPDTEYSEKQKWFLYRHELSHIRNHDTWIKLISLLSVAVHWYNPFIYLLNRKINQFSEYACDENVLDGLSEDDKAFYGNLLIQLSVSPHPNAGKAPVFSRRFSEHKNTLKRRLLTMMDFSPNKLVKKILVSAAALTFLVSSTITVFAYSPARTLQDTETKLEPFSMQNEDYYFTPGDTFYYPGADIDFSSGSQVFIDEDGNSYFVSDPNASPYVSCPHTYVSGTYHTHTLHADGSCTVNTYNARYCTKCGDIKRGSLISTLISVKCPHQN